MNKNLNLLSISNLQVKVNGKIILNNINLKINLGELHVILGPNGNGKTTLLHTIIGSPNYVISKGKILWKNKNINNLSAEERSRLGIFLGWQNPVDIEGLSNIDYLKLLINSNSNKKISTLEFYNILNDKVKKLNLPHDFLNRNFNVGFSGGEKKKNEILQLLILNPEFIMLDEIDSGLDIDSLKLIQKILVEEFKKNKSGLVISHYTEFLKYFLIKKVHILINGTIIETGNNKLIEHVKKYGFTTFYKKYNLSPLKKDLVLGHCGVGQKFNEKK